MKAASRRTSPSRLIEIREAQAMLQYQIGHRSSIMARRKEAAYFLNILGEFLGGTCPAAGFFVPEPGTRFNRRSVSCGASLIAPS